MSTGVYAVIRTGGKQYRVRPGQRLVVERLDGERGDEVAFEDVLMVRGDDGALSVGAPTLDNASVKAEIADQRRGKKIAVFKYKAKTRYRRLRGHRQQQTHLRISEIALGERSWVWEPPAPAAEVEPEVEDEVESVAEASDDAPAAEVEAAGDAPAAEVGAVEDAPVAEASAASDDAPAAEVEQAGGEVSGDETAAERAEGGAANEER